MALVTYESVAAAAEAIQQAGGKPSVRAVMSQLGGGSPNAIGPLLNEWRAGRPLVRASDIELDPRIAQLIAEQVQKAASDAARAAEERAATVQEDAEAVAEAGREAEAEAQRLTVALEAAHDEAARMTDELERMREQSERDSKASAEREAALKAEAEAERARGDQVAAQLAKAEVRLEALPELHAELERLRRKLIAAGQGVVLAPALAEDWFACCSARLDQMHSIESALAGGLRATCIERIGALQLDPDDPQSLLQTVAGLPEAAAPMGVFSAEQAADAASAGEEGGDAAVTTEPLGPRLTRSIVDALHAQSRRLQAMSDELAAVRAALDERKLIERAKGVLMRHQALAEDEAYRLLRQTAMNQGRRLVEVAQAVLAMAELLPRRS